MSSHRRGGSLPTCRTWQWLCMLGSMASRLSSAVPRTRSAGSRVAGLIACVEILVQLEIESGKEAR